MSLIILIFLFSLSANAQTESTVITTLPTSTSIFKNVSGAISLTGSSNINELEDFDSSQSASLEVITSYTHSKRWKSRLYLAGEKDLNGLRENRLSDGHIAIKGLLLSPTTWLDLGHDLRAYIPLSEVSRDEKSLNTRIMLAPYAFFNFETLGIKGLTLNQQISYSQYFHQFNTDVDGGSNKNFEIGTNSSLVYSITDWLYIGTYYIYQQAWTYQNNRLAPKFALGQNLGTNFNKNLSLTLTHENSGSFLGPNGQDSNLSLYDEDGSTYNVTLTYSY